MEGLEKPKRIKSRKTIEECRKAYCEICGSPAYGEPHHIKPRSLGGSDVRENQIELCARHHRDAQEGRIPVNVLLTIVARREGLPIEVVAERAGFVSAEIEELGKFSARYSDLVPLTLDEVLQRLISQREEEDDARWEMGRLAAYLIEVRLIKAADVAANIGCSAAQVREAARTYLAFPDESLRAKDLTWYHHRLASKTEDPGDWIDRAVANGWSTREMAKAIADERVEAGQPSGYEAPDMDDAKKALERVTRVMTLGGVAWEWLKKELRALVGMREGNEECQRNAA